MYACIWLIVCTLMQCSNTALHKAAKHAHMNVVELLVTKGANMNLRNKVHSNYNFMFTYFLYNFSYNYETIAILNYNYIKEDNTPLHLSSKEGHPMVLRYLLRHDANPKMRNKVA